MARGPLTRWLLEVHVDRRWYELRRSPEPIPAPGPPRTIALDPDDFDDQTVLVGRGSPANPVDVDLRPDTGVSRRHAELQHEDGHWYLDDLDSHNGTWVSPSASSLPGRRLTTRTRLADGMNVFLGGWTRLVLRRVDDGAPRREPGTFR